MFIMKFHCMSQRGIANFIILIKLQLTKYTHFYRYMYYVNVFTFKLFIHEFPPFIQIASIIRGNYQPTNL